MRKPVGVAVLFGLGNVGSEVVRIIENSAGGSQVLVSAPHWSQASACAA